MNKVLLFAVILLLTTTAHAATVSPLPPSTFQRFVETVKSCRFNVSCYFDNRFGASITTIQGTDTLKDSRTTINDNFSALNSTKLEDNNDTAVNLTVGSTTFGTLNATSTVTFLSALTVPNGGTGSTTLSQFNILLGSSTNALGIVSGHGTSGQFLTSNGAGAAPTWQTASVNQNVNYTWTAHHIFSSAFFTLASTTNATTTGSQYFTSLPSTILKTDSTGKLSAAVAGTDYKRQGYSFATTTDTTVSNGYATSTSFNIPAGVVSASSTINIAANVTAVDSGTDGQCQLYIRDTTGARLVRELILAAPTTDDTMTVNYTATVFFNSSVSSQTAIAHSIGVNAQNSAENLAYHDDNTASIDFTNATSLVGVIRSTAAGVACTLEALSFVLNP
jgi:hypothetical protein